MDYGTRILVPVAVAVAVALGTYRWGRVARRLKVERLKVCTRGQMYEHNSTEAAVGYGKMGYTKAKRQWGKMRGSVYSEK